MGVIESNVIICSRCVMDTSDEKIYFDSNGVCNHCYEYDKVVKHYSLPLIERKRKLQLLIENIKKAGKGRKFDCIIGLSGGADSSYVTYLAYKYGLRGLIVHLDNGWDSELAIKNIENIVKKTKFEYFNYLIDWEEMKEIQRAYFEASVVDVEVPTDMAISSLIPQLALKYNIKYILSGVNAETEFTMGSNWNYSKSDVSNLIGICKSYGFNNFNTFPFYTPLQQLQVKMCNIKSINILAFDECNYEYIKQKLSEEFNWKDYDVKHGESTFTKFYQSYYLIKKFNIDKRKAHLSDQINSGFISRDQALAILSMDIYKSKDDESREYNYVLNKLSYSKTDFERVLSAPIRSHSEFPVNQPYGNFIDKFILRIINNKLVVRYMRFIYRIYENIKFNFLSFT